MNGRARVGAVVLLLGVGVVTGHVTAGTAPRPPVPQQLPVVAATAVCPDLRQDGDRAATAVTAAALGAPAFAAGRVGATSAPLPAAPVVRDLGAGTMGPFAVTATGDGAGGLVVEQATRATGGAERGVAALTCPAPATSSWFVGGATVVGSESVLLLVNLEDVAALVDVRVWTGEGPADPRPGRGVSVPPRGRLAVPLDRLAPDRDLLALHVQVTRGRVASALRIVRSDGRTPLGTDWVPPAQPPAAELVVPGLPQGRGRRTALLTNPTDTDAVAQVELTTGDGQYVPPGLEAVPVPAGTSVSVDLSEQLAGTGAAVRVRSDGAPLLGGAVVVDQQDGPVREIAYSAATLPLDSPTLLADVRLSPASEVTLLLSAVDGDAVVLLRPLAAPGELPAAQRVEVPAASTVAVRLSRFLPPRSTGSLALEVRPLSGQVHGARYSLERGSRGPLTTLLPLTPSRLTATRPVVVADPGAGR